MGGLAHTTYCSDRGTRKNYPHTEDSLALKEFRHTPAAFILTHTLKKTFIEALRIKEIPY